MLMVKIKITYKKDEFGYQKPPEIATEDNMENAKRFIRGTIKWGINIKDAKVIK